VEQLSNAASASGETSRYSPGGGGKHRGEASGSLAHRSLMSRGAAMGAATASPTARERRRRRRIIIFAVDFQMLSWEKLGSVRNKESIAVAIAIFISLVFLMPSFSSVLL